MTDPGEEWSHSTLQDYGGTPSYSSQTDSEVEEDSSFLTIVERGIGNKLPIYLKNLLKFCGFDNPIAIAKLSDNDITDMETFAKDEMEIFIPENADLSNYYDKYHVCKDKFKICKGHKLLLWEVQNFTKEKLCENKYFFYPEYEFTQRNRLYNSRGRPQASIERSKPTTSHFSRNDLKNAESRAENSSNDLKEAYRLSDINLEHDTLYRLIKDCIKKQPNNEKLLEKLDPQSVEIYTEQLPSTADLGEGSWTYGAYITCPICSVRTKAHKFEYGKKGKRRWVKANFERHLKIHAKSSPKSDYSTSEHRSVADFTKISQKNGPSKILQQDKILDGSTLVGTNYNVCTMPSDISSEVHLLVDEIKNEPTTLEFEENEPTFSNKRRRTAMSDEKPNDEWWD